MVTFAQLKEVQPDVFRTAGSDFQAAASAIRSEAQQVSAQAGALSGGWTGEAASAAAAKITQLGSDLTSSLDRLNQVPTLLDSAASAIQQAKSELERAVEQTASTPLTVDGNGKVDMPTLTEETAKPYGGLARLKQLAEQITQAIEAAVRAATAADQQANAALAACVPGTLTALAGIGIPAGASPAAIAKWWSELTPVQQQALILSDPAGIGRLDGVPVIARDEANRLFLAAEKTRIGDRIAALKGKDDLSKGEKAELKLLNQQFGGIKSLDRRLHTAGPGLQRPYLIGFDTRGNGHAIVAMGNPDTAHRIATYVPGTGASLGKIGGDLDRADRMGIEALRQNPNLRTSTITWIGYDAPQKVIDKDLPLGLDDVFPGKDATRGDYARNAGEALDRFQDGLRVTHEGGRSLNTVVGHSYGSTVIGYTARDHGLDADRTIFVGSPGVGANHVDQLHLPKDSVYSSHAKNDPIQYGVDPGDVAKRVLTHQGEVDLIHGENPSSKDFGAQTFHSDDGTPLVKTTWEWRPGGGAKVEFSGEAHSQYWDEGSDGLENMGKIIVGQQPTR